MSEQNPVPSPHSAAGRGEPSAREALAGLLRRYDGRAPRYTSYPPIPYWGAAEPAEAAAHLQAPRGQGEGSLSLYTHIPFCRARCHYCGCFVVITPHQEPAERYLRAVHREMELVAEKLGSAGAVRQYHLGGGTPNFVPAEALGRLVERAGALFPFADDAELSIEVDPRHLDEAEVASLRRIGFNRISLGVQDFDETVQAGVARVEPYEHVARLMEAIRRQGYLGANFDLIYGLPHQNRRRFARTLERVLALRPHRVALYNFAYLPQAFPHQRRMDAEALPDPEEKLAIFLAAREAFTANGYAAIGLDHFALEDDDLAVAFREGTMRRNFMGYTTQAGTDLLAFGVSAISEYNGRFWQNEKKLARYQRTVEAGELPVVRGFLLDAEDRLRQDIISALFCKAGFTFAELEAVHGPGLRAHLAGELEALAPLAADGLVTLSDEGVRVNEWGQLFLRNVAMVFDNHRTRQEAPVSFSRTV